MSVQELPPPTDRETADGSWFRSALLAQAEQKRAELAALVRDRLRLDMEIERVKRYIEGMNVVLQAEGLDPISTSPEGGRGGFTAPGNRSTRVPPRREPFREMSLRDALAHLLSSGKVMHADELVEAIFELRDPDDHTPAKHTLVGAAAAGVKLGQLERAGPNRFRIKQETGG